MKAKGQRKVITGIVLIGLISIFIVVLSAYAAELKCGNNKLLATNAELRGDIDTIDVKIKAANSLDNIEKVATSKIGMVRAGSDECIEISETDEAMGNLAMIIKQNAYQ
jgi:hypothetical protein